MREVCLTMVCLIMDLEVPWHCCLLLPRHALLCQVFWERSLSTAHCRKRDNKAAELELGLPAKSRKTAGPAGMSVLDLDTAGLSQVRALLAPAEHQQHQEHRQKHHHQQQHQKHRQ